MGGHILWVVESELEWVDVYFGLVGVGGDR